MFLSGVNLPSIKTLLPFFKYWLQTSPSLPQAVQRNQVVILTVSPFSLVYWSFVATLKVVTGVASRGIAHFGITTEVTDEHGFVVLL